MLTGHVVELRGPGLPGVDTPEAAALGLNLLLQDEQETSRGLAGNRLIEPLFGEVLALLAFLGLLCPLGQSPPSHILYIELIAGGQQLVGQLPVLFPVLGVGRLAGQPRLFPV